MKKLNVKPGLLYTKQANYDDGSLKSCANYFNIISTNSLDDYLQQKKFKKF